MEHNAEISKLFNEILKKIKTMDYDFTYDFIESLKQYNSFYELLEIILLDIHLRNEYKDIEFVETDNLIIRLYYQYHILKRDRYNYEESEKKIYLLIEEINNVSDDEYNNLSFLYNQVSDDLDIKKDNKSHSDMMIEDHIFDELKTIKKYITSEKRELAIESINNFESKYPDYSKDTIKKFRYYIELYDTFDNQHLMNHMISMHDMAKHPMIQKKYGLDIMVTGNAIMNILRRNKKDYKSYMMHKDYYQHYDDYSNYIEHIFKTIETIDNMDNYYDYLKSLYHNRSILNHGVLSDYLILCTKYKDYHNIIELYDDNNLFIIKQIKKINNPLFKINCILGILRALDENNRFSCVVEIEKIIKDFDLNPSTYPEQMTYLSNLKKHIYSKQKYIELSGYLINYGDSSDQKIRDDCVICSEEIDKNIIATIKCPKCKKDIGHLNCVIKWLINNKKCPYCRQYPLLKK